MSDRYLAETIKAAIQEWDNQKAAGATREELIANLEKTLRVCWPFEREWRYLCEDCRDTGWRFRECNGMYCGRKLSHAPHEYVEPCYCEKGRMREPQQRTEVHELVGIGKTRKPTRYGRE